MIPRGDGGLRSCLATIGRLGLGLVSPARLRQSGSYLEAILYLGGRTLYRVLIGYQHARDVAQLIRNQS